jgi:hypothetical protein
VARVQLFISTVSAEFLSYRDRLPHLLTRPDVEVKVQEDLIVTGDETLEMLDTYIQVCDGQTAVGGGDRLALSGAGQPLTAGGVPEA